MAGFQLLRDTDTCAARRQLPPDSGSIIVDIVFLM